MHYRIRFDVRRLNKEFLEALHNKWGDLPKNILPITSLENYERCHT